MLKKTRAALCLIAVLCISFACQERQVHSKIQKPRLTEQDLALKSELLDQREQELVKKVEDIQSLLIKLEQKESELLTKENRLLEFEKRLQNDELKLAEKKKSLERFRLTSITILVLGILLMAGGIILIYKMQQKKSRLDAVPQPGFESLTEAAAVPESATHAKEKSAPGRKSRKEKA